MALAAMKFSLILWGLARLLNYTAQQASGIPRAAQGAQSRRPDHGARRGDRPLVRVSRRQDPVGDGQRKKADVTLAFKNATLGADLLMPPINWLDQINAQKDFKLTVDGPEDLTNWFAQTIMVSQSAGPRHRREAARRHHALLQHDQRRAGVRLRQGRQDRAHDADRSCQDTDGASWTIRARGMDFTPPRKTTLAPHGQNAKSIVYSPDRLLYPMKRVDFDPNGERNPQNRGKSGYVRISWDEALDLVANEIKRQKRTYGPGVIAVSHGSHHTWGNIGYYLSALFRFANAVGYTQIHHNPDSWEGWYWGAVHHWGYTLRVGQSETYGTVEDCLQNCDMIVFWAADPETTSGSYGAQEGTVRRQWLKNPKLGIKVVHVDPYYNASAQFLPGKWFAPKPTTSVAMAMAIAYVWIKEGLYDKDYVETHTVGFDKWKAYLTGDEDGIAEDAGVAGEGNRRSGEGRARAGARMGQEARLSRARRLGQRPRRRLPQPDRHPVGARDGVPLGDAGARQARLQHGQPAVGHAGRLQFLLPRLFRRRHVGRPRKHRDAGRALPAHAAAADHELERPAHPAHLDAGGDHRRQGRRLSVGRQVDRAPVRQVRLSGARPFAGEDALQVRRLDPLAP